MRNLKLDNIPLSKRLITNLLPGLKADLIPAYWNDEGKRVVPHGWQNYDSSDDDMDKGSDVLYGKKPEGYGVIGRTYPIVDIDIKTPEGQEIDPEQAFRIMDEAGLNPTFTVRSKSGGIHLYYDNPGYETKTMANWSIYKGDEGSIDIRGTGGYVQGPDLSIDSEDWEPGHYVVIRNLPVAKCDHELPQKNESKNVTEINVKRNAEMKKEKLGEKKLELYRDIVSKKGKVIKKGAIVKKGERDNILLLISGYCTRRGWGNQEIYDEFVMYEFAAGGEGDEITFEHLLEKVDRDNKKNESEDSRGEQVFKYLMENLHFLSDGQKMYNSDTNTRVTSLEGYHACYPYYVKRTNPKSGNLTVVKVTEAWRESPDKIITGEVGHKPIRARVYEESGKMFSNSFVVPEIIPWEEPVGIDHPLIIDFVSILRQLCNGNDDTLHLLLSQRAKKIQEPLWSPHWGFVMITEKFRLGKGLQAQIFASIMTGSSNGYTEIKPADILDGRNRHAMNSMLVCYSEPVVSGLNNNQGSALIEGIKLFMSETAGQIKLLYCNHSVRMRFYFLSEIHSNTADFTNMSEGNRRFAPIFCSLSALPKDVYSRVVRNFNEVEDKEGNIVERLYERDSVRALTRFLMDYEVSEHINDVESPVMPDVKYVAEKSQGIDYGNLLDSISNHQGALYSDGQTLSTMREAIADTQGVSMNRANELMKRLRSENIMIPFSVTMGMPTMSIASTRDASQYMSELSRIKLISGGKASVFIIRNHEVHLKFKKSKDKMPKKYVMGLFFNQHVENEEYKDPK
ncbi:MAG: hypothetical protein DRP85_03155 [Candidatus Makaraimicrobium thalassicum]|nr:MAG: hypothetical protein DRP85_03155 [Candidatus Omnitrophota bacterium]